MLVLLNLHRFVAHTCVKVVTPIVVVQFRPCSVVSLPFRRPKSPVIEGRYRSYSSCLFSGGPEKTEQDFRLSGGNKKTKKREESKNFGQPFFDD